MHDFHMHVLDLIFAGILAKLPPVFWCWCFFVSFSNILKTLFFRTPGCTKASLSSIEKDSKATTRDSFKDCMSLHVKLEIKCIQILRKENFHKQSVIIWLKNGCSVRHMLCTIFVPLSVTKILEKHVRSSSYFL